MVFPADIGRLLIEARRARGMSQLQLAALLGCTQPQIARWERSAYRTTRLETVDRVARLLGVGIGELPVAAEAPATYAPDVKRPMTELLGVSEETIAAFCRSHGVEELAVFGSIVRGDFRADSDVDLLVTWHKGRKPSTFSELDDVEAELRGIFRRRVDLIDRRVLEASENHLRRDEILSAAKVLYAAR